MIKEIVEWNEGLSKVDKIAAVAYSLLVGLMIDFFGTTAEFIKVSDYLAAGLSEFEVAHITLLNFAMLLTVLGLFVFHVLIKTVGIFRKVYN